MISLKKNSIVVTMLLFIAAGGIPHRQAAAMQPRFTTASQAGTELPHDPTAILAKARIINVRSRTVLVKSEVIESELQKRADFQHAGLLLTRDPMAADLTMEVRRANFTTEYPYVVIDSKTKLVVASGKVNSLFGTAAGKIAKGFMKQVLQARKVPSS